LRGGVLQQALAAAAAEKSMILSKRCGLNEVVIEMEGVVTQQPNERCNHPTPPPSASSSNRKEVVTLIFSAQQKMMTLDATII
jgi:hypothetical protein